MMKFQPFPYFALSFCRIKKRDANELKCVCIIQHLFDMNEKEICTHQTEPIHNFICGKRTKRNEKQQEKIMKNAVFAGSFVVVRHLFALAAAAAAVAEANSISTNNNRNKHTGHTGQ